MGALLHALPGNQIHHDRLIRNSFTGTRSFAGCVRIQYYVWSWRGCQTLSVQCTPLSIFGPLLCNREFHVSHFGNQNNNKWLVALEVAYNVLLLFIRYSYEPSVGAGYQQPGNISFYFFLFYFIKPRNNAHRAADIKCECKIRHGVFVCVPATSLVCFCANETAIFN